MARTILVLGAAGMLGNACFRAVGDSGDRVFGSVRSKSAIPHFPERDRARLISGVDALDDEGIEQLLERIRPDVVLNCIGMIKQLTDADDPLEVFPLNTLFPLRLEQLCEPIGARLIHFSTDCVFNGLKGNYVEGDPPDANDLYGISKRFGEVSGPNAITLRTSIIGHELASSRSLIGWFLSQQTSAKGFTGAIFSGLPTVEIARIIREFVIPSRNMSGVYHVSAEPISKYDLLCLVAEIYKKEIIVAPSDDLRIDRSLDSRKFRAATGYIPPPWPELVRRMHEFS